MASHGSQRLFLFFCLVFSLTTVLVFWDVPYLRPLRYFSTAIHEACHALAAILTGGTVVEIHLDGESGHMQSYGGIRLIVSPAGYVGTALIGMLLLLAGRNERSSDQAMVLLGGIVGALVFLYTDSFFNLYVILTLGLCGLIILSTLVSFTRYITLFISTFLMAASLDDARVYLFSKLGGDPALIYRTDAGILARYLGFELLALPIAFVFFLMSAWLYWYGLKRFLRLS